VLQLKTTTNPFFLVARVKESPSELAEGKTSFARGALSLRFNCPKSAEPSNKKQKEKNKRAITRKLEK
jgi:hypothetical protein